MRAFSRTRPFWLPLLVLAVVLAIVFPWPAPAVATAADARLERASAHRSAVQQRLDEVLQRVHRLQSETERVQRRLDDLHSDQAAQRREAEVAGDALAARIRDSYKHGEASPVLAILTASSPGETIEQSRLLAAMATRNRATFERSVAARTRTRATAEQVQASVEDLRAREADLEAVRAEATALLAEAAREEARVREVVAAEAAAREQARRRQIASRNRAAVVPSTSGGGSASVAAASAPQTAAAVSGGIACPVGTPRNYSDTWGAPRSGGRAHKGTDILAPQGTPSYAYEAGTISRMNGSSLGGISLYMQGDSGNVYYYTHLSGYAASSRVGKRVGAGELIAYVGDTGNAAGIPHLHFEVMPGGGGSVNPYPYVLRACG